MEKPVIGLDFGNYNSFICFIKDFASGTRMGGMVYDLLPGNLQDGIPSVYFYSQKAGVLCGEEAVRTRARPVKNRIRYLKRHLGQTMQLDDRAVSYDEAITGVIQHCVRSANEKLQAGWQMTTNLISLSYPATFSCAQRQQLIELAEKATLADGTPVKVSGTIAEPAAAALDYLADFAKTGQDTTVLTYDLGGGTFDLSLVAAYPAGRKNAEGNLYYYDIINARGLSKVGGAEFDEILYQLLLSKIKEPLKQVHKDALREMAEKIKIDLSADPYAEAEISYNDGYLSVQVTREEFEQAAKELLTQTIKATREILRDHPNQQPDMILLTGGASQMPMVQKALEAALPQFKDKIIYFRPSRAIAYGAARFGTVEAITDPSLGAAPVQMRTMYDIGVRFYRSVEDENGYVLTYIPAGTPIPCKGEFHSSQTLYDNQLCSRLAVYEAVVPNPVQEQVNSDYQEIMYVTIDHGGPVPQGTRNESRLNIDRLGVLTIEARNAEQADRPLLQNTVQLKNLS